MKLFERIGAAFKAFISGDSEGFFPISHAGAHTLSSTGSTESALHLSAYFACVRNISEDVAKLPLIVYRRLPGGGKEKAKDHPLYKILRTSPHPAIGAFALRETLTRFATSWGNGYAQIVYKNNGQVAHLVPYHPERVSIEPLDDGSGDVRYIVSDIEQPIPSKEMIHIHGMGSDGLMGMPVVAFANSSISFAEASQDYGKNLYARGGRPGGILTHPSKLQKETKKALGEAWDKAYGGNNAGSTAVLDQGIDYKAITVNPVDVQYLETRQFSVEEIARWFRMPLHKIQYLLRAQGWSTLDAQNTDYLTDALMPWLVRWEEELNRKLFADDPDYFCEHLVTGLLRGDQKTRASYYVSLFSIGGLSINEIRDLENMNPIEGDGGDKHFVPLNMTPAEFASSVSGGKDTQNGTA